MWLDSKAVNCPQKWGNFTGALAASFDNAARKCWATPRWHFSHERAHWAKCYVWLHEWQLANLNHNYTLPIFENYKELKARISKALVFLLPAWFFASQAQGYFEKDYLDFCNTLGISPQRYLSKARERVQPALDELKIWGHLSDWQIRKTTDGQKYKLRFYFGPRYTNPEAQLPPQATPAGQGEGGVHPAQLQALIDRDIPKSKATSLLQGFQGDFPLQLAFLDHRIGESADRITGKVGFYIRGFEEPYPPTPEFQARFRARQERLKQQLELELEDQYRDYCDALIDAYIADHPEQYKILFDQELALLKQRYLDRPSPVLGEKQFARMAEHQARPKIAEKYLELPTVDEWRADQKQPAAAAS